MSDQPDMTVVTEEDVRNLPFGSTFRINELTLITPLASDLAAERRIIFERVADAAHRRRRRIAIGADHGGFEMKEALKGVITSLGADYQDFGTNSLDPVDYPDFALPVALAVSRRMCDLGIVIDGAGIGSCMVANKVPGVRAAMCYDEASARNSREHNGANVLTLAGGRISSAEMARIVQVWIAAELTEERHRRRVAKINAVL